MKVTEKVKGLVKKTKEDNKMKNWSLKKKVIVGMGVLGTAALGVIAYGRSKQDETVNYDPSSDDEDYDYEEESEDDEESTYETETSEQTE